MMMSESMNESLVYLLFFSGNAQTQKKPKHGYVQYIILPEYNFIRSPVSLVHYKNKKKG